MTLFNVKVTEDATKKVIMQALNSFDIRTKQNIYTLGASKFTPLTGSQVLSNREFTNNADQWALGSGWVYSDGKIVVTSGDTIGLTQVSGDQQNAIVDAKTYEVIFTISDYSNGAVTPRVGSAGVGTARSANGTFTESIVAAGNLSFFMYGSTGGGNLFSGSIDIISCTVDFLDNKSVSIGATLDVDISSMFTDPDVGNRETGVMDSLVITASSSNADQCGASVFKDSSGNTQLRLTGYATGTPTITVKATDLHGGSVNQTIVVTVS